MAGSIETVQGTVAVRYLNDGEKVKFEITVPKNTKAIFRYKNKELILTHGENKFEKEL